MSASEPLTQSSQKPTSNNNNNKEPQKSLNNQSLLVFQCKNCLKIIGDSICYLTANTKLRSIVLTVQHPNTILGNEVSTSNEEYDLGCTFIRLNCKFCKNKLGRVYRATNSKLDYLRDKYTYHVDNFTTYQLGSYSKSGETITQGEQILELGDTKPILESISRVKEVICAFHDRISKLENLTNSLDFSLNNNNNLSQLSIIGENANNESNSKLDDGIIVLDEEEEEEVIKQLNNKTNNDNNDYSGEQEESEKLQNNINIEAEEEEEDHNETYNGEKDDDEVEESTNNRGKSNSIRRSNNDNNNDRRELRLRSKKKIKYTR